MRPTSVSAFRRPEQTGENRCWPCTVVNVALVAVGAAVLAVLASPVVGVAAAVAGLALVWLRGYLVPGTPRFAPSLVAALPRGEELFHGAETDDSEGRREGGSLGGDVVPDDVGELLERQLEAGLLEVDGDTVAPTAAYDERWRAEMDRLRDRTTEELAAAAAEISPATDARAIRDDDEWIALSEEGGSVIDETWITRPVAIAEIAGFRAAGEFLSEEAIRLAAAQANRMFLDSCPDCGTELERGTDMPCCGGHTGPGEEPAETLVCPSCEVRLFTFGDR